MAEHHSGLAEKKPVGTQAHQSSWLTPNQEDQLAPPLPPLLQWQQKVGNRAIGQFLQPKLTIDQPGDQYEQEADRIADHIVSSAPPHRVAPGNKPSFSATGSIHIQREENDKSTKVLSEGASVTYEQLKDQPGFEEWKERQTDALKLKLWDSQPTELKAGIIGFSLFNAGVLGTVFALDPGFRSRTIDFLQDTNLLLPLSLLPYSEYFPVSSFKYKLPTAQFAPYTFETEFSLDAWLKLMQGRWPIPRLGASVGVDSRVSESGGFSPLTGGNIKLKFGGGIVNLSGFYNQALPPTPMLISNPAAGEPPMWLMRSLPGQLEENLPQGSGVFLTVDVLRLPQLFGPPAKVPPPTIQRKKNNRHDSGHTPTTASLVHQELNAGQGVPLGLHIQQWMESRFEQDFSQVRIHTGPQAASSAQAVNARAYTSGTHIVFDSGEYEPDTTRGQRLLAHELTHVVQQSRSGTNGPTLQRKKPETVAKPRKFYQDVIDALDYQKKRMAEQAKQSPLLVIEHLNFPGLKALVPLCEAVEQERKEDIPKLLDTFIEKDIGFHLGTIRVDLMIELATRMFRIGLEAESKKLRAHFDKQSQFSPQLPYDLGASQRRVDFFTSLVDNALATADSSTPQKTEAALSYMIRVFVPLRDAMAEIDYEALAFERQMGRNMVFRPAMTRVEYYDALFGLVQRLYSGIEALIQALMDTATAELESGKGTATLTLLRDVLNTRLKPVLLPDDNAKYMGGLTLKITRTILKKGQGRIEDIFLTGKAAKKRSVAVTTYDPEQEYVQELQMTLERLFETRREQVIVLAQIYGATALIPVARDKEGVLSEDAKRNAAAIQRLEGGRLRLHSDDDWRAFVLQKYQDMVKPNPPLLLKRPPAEALSAVIKLLFTYLHAFTTHARHTNIYDIGDSYLNKDFPRALSGQLVHDCGVYAVRVAYILSLVRHELKLRFRFVQLPSHVALVIEGDNLPAFIAHNNHYEEIPADDWENLRKNWEAFTEIKKVSDETGMVTVEMEQRPSGPHDKTQFIGEIAGASFISGPLDMPFSVTDVPETGGPAKQAQQKLWAHYQRLAGTNLFGPASKDKNSPYYLFHQRYLGMTEQFRQMHNDVVLKFWNEEAPAAWASFEKALVGDGKRSSLAAAELLPLLKAHAEAYAKSLEPVTGRLTSLHQQERSISAQIRGQPKLQRQGIRLSYGPRAATLYTFHYLSYQRRLAKLIEEMAKPKAADKTVKDVRDRLVPPFVPVEEKAIPRLD